MREDTKNKQTSKNTAGLLVLYGFLNETFTLPEAELCK